MSVGMDNGMKILLGQHVPAAAPAAAALPLTPAVGRSAQSIIPLSGQLQLCHTVRHCRNVQQMPRD